MTIEKPKPDMVFNVWTDRLGRRGITQSGRLLRDDLREVNDAWRGLGLMFVPYRIRVYLKPKKAA